MLEERNQTPPRNVPPRTLGLGSVSQQGKRESRGKRQESFGVAGPAAKLRKLHFRE